MNKKVKYLRNLQKLEMTPTDAYMTQNVPVMPPSMRPISALPDGTLINDDLNHMYKGLGLAAKKFKDTSKHDLPEEYNDRRAAIYDGMKALTGVGGHMNRRYRGVLDIISGKSLDKDTKQKGGAPRESYFQSKLIKRKQDMSMRSTIIPEPELGLDQVGIPRKAAMEIYKPFVVRELRGLADVTPLKAQQMIKEKDSLATRALERVVQERPIMLKRDPVLHKYGVQAFKPVLTSGKAVKIHPLVTSGFNADFDGNCVDSSSEIGIRWDKPMKELAMKFRRDTEVTVRDEGTAIYADRLRIDQFPKEDKPHRYDKHGAAVYRVPEGLQVLSYDHFLGEETYEDVTEVTVEENCQVAEVFYSGGYRVIASTNESLCVYDHETGQIKKVCPAESINALSPTVPAKSGNKYDKSYGWMIGAFASDGFFTNGRLGLVKLNEDFRDKFFSVLQREGTVFGRYFYKRLDKGPQDLGERSKKDHYHVSEELLAIFRDCYVPQYRNYLGKVVRPAELKGNRACLFKSLPSSLGDFSRDALLGVLSGLLDGDGTLSWSNGKAKRQLLASYSTSSVQLKEDVRHLCRLLNIRCSVSEVRPDGVRPQKHVNYIIAFSTVDLFTLIDELELVAYSDVLEELRRNPPVKDDRDIVPIPISILHRLGTRKSDAHAINPKLVRTLAALKSKEKEHPRVSRSVAIRILPFLDMENEMEAYWSVLVHSEIRWARVEKAVNRGKTTTYDLVIPTTKVFAVNHGLIVWDTMSAFVPVSHEAVAEARKMYPSRNLFSPATGSLMYRPTHESQLGLYTLTQEGKSTGKMFKNVGEAAKEAKADGIGMNDMVTIGKTRTSVGRALVANALPKSLQSDVLSGRTPLDGKGQEALLTRVAKQHKNDFGDVANKLKDLGNSYATTNVVSIGLDDIKADKVERDKILASADRRVAEVMAGKGSKEQKEKLKVQVYDRASAQMIKAIDEKHGKPGATSAIHTMMKAGVKPQMGAYRQITMAPMLMMNAKSEIIPNPIRRSWSEGLDVGDYWTQMSGARKGVVQKVQSVQEPGYFTKQVVNSVMNNAIGSDDCGTSKGISLPVDERDILDRYLASGVKSGSKSFKAGTLVTPGVRDSLRNNKVRRVVVRSPLRCEHEDGICGSCFGLDEDGVNPPVGKNVGIMAAQSIGERATQLAMKSFHCLHEHSAILIRKNDEISHTTLGRLYQDGVEGLQVWDVDGWTEVESVSRHIQSPDTAMVMIRSRSGFSSVSQDDHPHMLRENKAACLDCGTFPKKQLGGYRCRKCGHYWKGEISDDALVEMVPPRELIRLSHRATLDSGPEPTAQQPVVRDGWLAGIYCAEGCINVRDQNRAPYVTGITISQKRGEVYEKIATVLESEVGKCSRSPRGLRVYSIDVGNEFMAQFGRYSSNVGLPPGWSGYPREWLLDFVAGFIDGDGTTQRSSDTQWTSFCIDTTSYLAAQQLHWILRREGVQARVALSSWRDISSHQGLQVKGVITERLKELLPGVKKLDVSGKPSHLSERFADVVDYVKPFIFSSPPYVYDIKTCSGTFFTDGFLTHNSGGVAPVGKKGRQAAQLADEFKRVQQLTMMPKHVPGAATLSSLAGKVTKVTKDPAGGTNVFVNNVRHYVPQDRGEPMTHVGDKPQKVRRGMQIGKGSPLSGGPVNMNEMLPLTGINKVQGYMAGQLYDLYKGEGIRRRNIETVVKSMTNLTEVKDPGDHSDFIRGDFAPTSRVQALNKQLAGKKKKPIVHAPVLKGVKTLPLDMQTDWMARLNHENLNTTVIDAANQGWTSNIHGKHPVPALAYGAELGKKKPY